MNVCIDKVKRACGRIDAGLDGYKMETTGNVLFSLSYQRHVCLVFLKK